MASLSSVLMPLEYYNYTSHGDSSEARANSVVLKGTQSSCSSPATGVRRPAELTPDCVLFCFFSQIMTLEDGLLRFWLVKLFSYMTSVTPSSDQVRPGPRWSSRLFKKIRTVRRKLTDNSESLLVAPVSLLIACSQSVTELKLVAPHKLRC